MTIKDHKFPLEIIIQNIPCGISSYKTGVYIHIPFCKTKCSYCAFVSGSPLSEHEMDEYIVSLISHIKMGSEAAGNRTISSIFFGGGTPSYLGASRLSKLLITIFESFSVEPTAEITIEANPESASKELFQQLVRFGVNRVSLGVQSFHDDELIRLGRIHSADEAERAIENIRNAGITNLSIDLIFAVPNQTIPKWKQTIVKAVDLEPDHISAYGLSFDEGTLFHRLNREGKMTPVLERTFVEMYDIIKEYLASKGMHHYEISNWSRFGKECRHNLIYWDREEYLSFGVAAHGMLQGIRFGFTPDRIRYIEIINKLDQNNIQEYLHPELIEEMTTLDNEEAASDAMIFGLRKIEGISIERFQKRYGYSPSDRWGKEIERFFEKGWMEQNNGFLRLSSKTLLISNEVLQYFL